MALRSIRGHIQRDMAAADKTRYQQQQQRVTTPSSSYYYYYFSSSSSKNTVRLAGFFSLSLCNTTCGIYVDWRTVESNTFKYPGPDIVQLNITRTRYRPTLLLHSCLPSIGYYYIPNGVDGPFISRPVYIL
jgi:hypothetical protein